MKDDELIGKMAVTLVMLKIYLDRSGIDISEYERIEINTIIEELNRRAILPDHVESVSPHQSAG